MAARRSSVEDRGPGERSGGCPIPGFSDADSFVKHVLGTVVSATKASNGLPQPGDEFDFYRSFPGFQAFCDTQADQLLSCMSQLMQYHSCRSHIKGRHKVTELEDKFDLLVDANDVILEQVGILLDEASGVNKNQQPVLPEGLQPPKTIISSWNRKNTETKRSKSETFRLFHAKNIPRPQMKFKEKVDNSNTPFVPKLFTKPNALKPLPEVFLNRRSRMERPEDLDVPAALADFIHQQRTQQNEQNMFAHPYQYELNHFEPSESVLAKTEPQMYKPLSETNFHLITTFEELVELNEKLSKCKEFAVDLEHHSYRSFLGLTCLMQLSTREEDFVIDTLELRSEMYILNEVFTDPSIVKVFHGADSDVEWLQRDLGLYVVNMFDTHQAARILNLGRHSLDYLLKQYCDVQADKRYQLADWRIRPLPNEMLHYAQEDTHYLLYIYDKMKNQLWEQGNEQANLVQMVCQKSRDICLKKYYKPIFTEESYLDLYRKQKKQLNTQQLTAFRLLYAWRDKISRLEDESTGYVLPNHMMIKIAEELPKEPQGIIACCNPIPPLVRQQINELHLLVQQARDMPLLKTESTPLQQKKGPLLKADKTENVLFGPHDSSHLSGNGSVPLIQTSKLFPELEDDNVTLTLTSAKAIVTIFDDPATNEKEHETLTTAQQKARAILESFENPFRMYLPSKDSNVYISQAAKFDPSTKIYEVSNRWKLLSQEHLQKEATKKQEQTKKAKDTPKPEVVRQQMQQDYIAEVQEIPSVRQQAAMAAEQQSVKRERAKSGTGTETAPPEKKKPKSGIEELKNPKSFKPFDYSKSNFKVFAAGSKSKESTQFDPSHEADVLHSKKTGKKNRQSAGNRSMTFTSSKSDRGFRHSWPKR
ncbi:exosome component 10 [Carcharodon carcharias]|uniref:exosome component 10 n=1 Tax=Carcharodon carcharias TaxID=13397 RepID=UPI001B7F5AE1|nr:exosome component 10 [Carcharodon carcharias]